ncbi:MAG: triose-phosphate isomerase [Candidatus Moranbacteria bacterium]|nr:triose-phosphate isomerase [Candidatus Moranbacteria bacterium]
MRKFYVVGNLKMNILSREEVTQYLSVLKREAENKHYQHVTLVVCPPFLYLSQFDDLPQGIAKGAQNLFSEKSGAYTGEISPVMLKNDNVEYVILGHSERRRYGGETNEMIRGKILAAIKHHMTPIVCIGETEKERRAEETDRALELQIKTLFSGFSKSQAERVIVAYEPLWAVGTDVVPTTGEILQVRVLLRKLFTEMFDAETAGRIVILYGGSVKSSFLGAVSWEAEMDGVLVGRESLFPYELVKMMGLFEEAAGKEL